MRSSLAEIQSIYYGSNACYLVRLVDASAGQSLAIYKPARGEYPLWDFPTGSLHRREVAAYRLDSLLGWGLVPPTVIARGKFGLGSLQLFIEETSHEAVPVASLRRLALLDWVINNADRKPDHLLVACDGRLWGIDHGLTFHAHPKLRTVLWHFSGERLETRELEDLRRLRRNLDSPTGNPVRDLLDATEYRALIKRIDALTRGEVFPNPDFKAVPYRW